MENQSQFKNDLAKIKVDEKLLRKLIVR